MPSQSFAILGDLESGFRTPKDLFLKKVAEGSENRFPGLLKSRNFERALATRIQHRDEVSNQSAQRRRVGAYESTFLQFVCVFSLQFRTFGTGNLISGP